MSRLDAQDILRKLPLKAAKKVRESPKKLILASICDILFFVVYGFITAPLFTKIVDYIIIIGTMVSESAQGMARGASPTIGSAIVNNPQVRAYFNKLILIYIILAVAIYIVYTFFHGVCWKLSSDIAGRKVRMHKFLKEFAAINIFWILIFIIYHFLSLFADLRQAALQTMEIESANIFGIVIVVLLFVLLYFAFTSYTLVDGKGAKGKIKKSFSIGTRKISQLLPAYVVVAVAYIVLQRLLLVIAGIDYNLMIIAGILTIIPGMTLARVYITLAVEKAK